MNNLFVGSPETASSSLQSSCFHCGLPVPAGFRREVEIDGRPRLMCCHGCAAVAESIVNAGLNNFYKFRTSMPATANARTEAALEALKYYDEESVQRRLVSHPDQQVREVSLILEGITCAACVWLNEKHLQGLPGVLQVKVNYASQRMWVRWDSTQIRLSEILQAIEAIGYKAYPYDPATRLARYEKTRKALLQKLGIAYALGMQVMILAVAMYVGAWAGMEAGYQQTFRWLALLLTTPVLLYSGRTFFVAAWRDIRHRRIGMDIPVSLGLGLAFGVSVYATLSGTGEVYFESVVMFIALLLTARYFEYMARHRALESIERLSHSQPLLATRLRDADDDSGERIPAAQLAAGDLVLIRPGETVPADGEVVAGSSSVNEAIVTGESAPAAKRPGMPLIGGTVNNENPLWMRVTRAGEQTLFSSITRMMLQAQQDKPVTSQVAERVAPWFIAFVLVLAVGVSVFWSVQGNPQWLLITAATLMITCPCALSLATPAALTAGMAQMMKAGILARHSVQIAKLAKVTRVVFDKTGTLTDERFRLVETRLFAGLDQRQCLQLAASLEQFSSHPIAQALVRENRLALSKVEQVSTVAGTCIQGELDGKKIMLGAASILTPAQRARVEASADGTTHTQACLVYDGCLLAVFYFADTLRAGARQLVRWMQARGLTVDILSGDNQRATGALARRLGVDHYRAAVLPEQKLEYIRALQQQGECVMMVGDGVNDAPVLAGADVSVTLQSGTGLAISSADYVVLSANLARLMDLFRVAAKTMQVVRQNISWAVAYNALALPVAAIGWAPPWVAATGMAASSLLVTLNALRLRLLRPAVGSR